MSELVRRACRLGVILASACCISASAPPDAKPSTVGDAKIQAMLDTAEWSNKSGRYESGAGSLQPVVDSELYAELSPGYRQRVDRAYGEAQLYLGKSHLAHAAYVRATTSSLTTAEDWYGRLQAAMQGRDFADAYACLKTVEAKWPAYEPPFSEDTLKVLDYGFGTLPNWQVARPDFEFYLLKRGWTLPDELHFNFVLHLLEVGRLDDAREGASRFRTPGMLALAKADKRFDPIWSSLPASFVPLTVAEARLEYFKEASLQDPDSLLMKSATASAYSNLGRDQDAATWADDVIDTVWRWDREKRPPPPNVYADYQHGLVQKAFYAFDMGRYEEALATSGKLGGGPEHIPRLTLTAKFLVNLGRGSEALKQLAPLSDDNYDLRWAAEIAYQRACAAHQADNRDVRDRALKYLREHWEDDPRMLTRALLCTGAEDDAAAIAVLALESPRSRHLMLDEMQNFLRPPKSSVFASELRGRLRRMIARPDVTAAVAKVGRINTYPVRSYFHVY